MRKQGRSRERRTRTGPKKAKNVTTGFSSPCICCFSKQLFYRTLVVFAKSYPCFRVVCILWYGLLDVHVERVPGRSVVVLLSICLCALEQIFSTNTASPYPSSVLDIRVSYERRMWPRTTQQSSQGLSRKKLVT